MNNHNLFYTLKHLKGNPRACVYTEPLWGIPFNLFSSYASVYMLALGVTDVQIGIIASIALASQIIFSLLGGIITDKLGRRKATLIFDTIGWSIPCLIWSISQDFRYFAVAAMVNGVMRVTANSWNCLLVEDADKENIVSIFTWIYILVLGAAFFTPITGLLVKKFDLIPAIRAVYFFAAAVMTLKFVLTFIFSTETKQGIIRMKETKSTSIFKMLHGYGPVIKAIFKTPETVSTLGLMIIMGIVNMVNGSFWSVIVTQKIKIPNECISIFPFVRSIILLIFFFTIIHKINVANFKRPMIFGFFTFTLSQIVLLITPEKGISILIISIILEACSLSLINPLLDSLQVVMVDPNERARIIAVLFAIVLLITSPFGWIAGLLSGIDRRFPFVMNIILLVIGMFLTYIAASKKSMDSQLKPIH